MGHPSPTEPPEIPAPPDTNRVYVMPASVRPTPVTRHVVLFALTFITTTLVGAELYAGFITGFDANVSSLPSLPTLIVHGMWYSVSVLAILGVHEFGHYFACRYYRVDASLPYFIPLPFLIPGTLGAVIRIRQPIPSKRQYFDIGIAGPIAGFIVIIPVLILGLSLSNVVVFPPGYKGQVFNEPLLFQLVERFFFGNVPVDRAINLHPAGWAAWFGLLATALNLCPVGQLDGGHVAYAVFGRKSSLITIAVATCLIGLTVYSLVFLHTPSYLLWTALVTGMLIFMGPHHPRVLDEHERLDGARLLLAVGAAVILVLSFTPVPTSMIGF